MTDLVVIVPSRGRPLAAKEMGRAFQDTHAYRTRLVFAVDADDPTLADYGRERLPGDALIVSDAPSNMVQTLNYAARRVLEQDRPKRSHSWATTTAPATSGGTSPTWRPCASAPGWSTETT
jgi:hypothetical protein